MKTKHLTFLFLFIVFSNTVLAQNENKFYGEIHLLRFARDNGMDRNDVPPFEFSYINGLEVGYNVFHNFNIHLRYQGIPLQFTSENNRMKKLRNTRVGWSIGLEYARRPERKFFLSYSAGYFREISKDNGRDCSLLTSPGRFEPLIRERIFHGISYQANFNFKIKPQVFLVLAIRNRTGEVLIKNRDENSNIFCSLGKYSGESFAPLSKLAIRVLL